VFLFECRNRSGRVLQDIIRTHHPGGDRGLSDASETRKRPCSNQWQLVLSGHRFFYRHVLGKQIDICFRSGGETITIVNGTTQTRIRLHGIDCPESGQAFGKFAKRVTSDLCFGRIVKFHPTDIDRYGRAVAIVYLENGRELFTTLADGPARLGEVEEVVGSDRYARL
jgi:hypothetical protein